VRKQRSNLNISLPPTVVDLILPRGRIGRAGGLREIGGSDARLRKIWFGYARTKDDQIAKMLKPLSEMVQYGSKSLELTPPSKRCGPQLLRANDDMESMWANVLG
jgi:hypothetical protein